MLVDVVDLRQFYKTQLGKAACTSIAREIADCFKTDEDTNLIGLGYLVPLFNELKLDNGFCLMPARQGALKWPKDAPSKTALVDENELPIPNASVDVLVMMHVLENVADPGQTLEEVWRVLAPEGRVIVIASHRGGPWARLENTPFGNGQPFSKRQLRELLREAKLTIVQRMSALHFPPFKSEGLLKFRSGIEAIAKRIVPAFSGVIIVEATKRLYQGIPVGTKKTRKVLVPNLSPQGMTRSKRQSELDR